MSLLPKHCGPGHRKYCTRGARDFRNTIQHTLFKENHLAKSKSVETKFSILPPSHLSKESAAFFKRTVALYEFDEHHVKLLTDRRAHV